ncbi:MAG: TonB-dependent receptor [Gilvibacter sp.]
MTIKTFIKSLVCITVVAFFGLTTYAQQTISGTVSDAKGVAIEGANIFLDGTYDGASSDLDGNFTFETEETGVQVLTISFVSFEPYSVSQDVSTMQNIKVVLQEDVNSLETVVLSAGTFEASDNSKVSVLKPLDVVTTASALGDFVGALQTLPGTTTVAEDGRLFVRGGEAGETQIFIDGIRVFTPYSPTTNNIPTRGRYSPFLFDGITFSTGGYSAEYGQALSSVLLLNTIDKPDQEKTDISVMSVGGGIGHTKIWEKSSLSLNAMYINLAPYIALFPDRNDWHDPFEVFSGEAVYRHDIEDGIIKAYAAFDTSNFSLTQEDINAPEGLSFALKNKNFYSNVSLYKRLGNGWRLNTGSSFTYAKDDISIDESKIKDRQNSAHIKVKLRKRYSSKFKWAFGAEQFITSFDERFIEGANSFNFEFNQPISAVFSETDLIFSRDFAMKLGARAEYTPSNDRLTFSPRASMAYKLGNAGQLSLAYGDFYQQANNEYLKFDEALDPQKTQHYILNYQYVKAGRILRAELYRKQYNDLVTFDTPFAFPDSNFRSLGDGFSQGFDLFWRDNDSFKNLDYWVSYSYLDTERSYLNYPEAATPPFANSHNLSVVAKYWIQDWKSQIGFSYGFASGRTYTNPNLPGFLQEQTKAYNSLSINWAYLIDPQKILYFSVNNALGFNNINGYQYANTPNSNGVFDRRALRPAADQFFFVGFFWTLSEDGVDNQLDNL